MKTRALQCLYTLAGVLMTSHATAQGLDKVGGFLDNFSEGMAAWAVATVTIALLVCGYLLMFRSATWALIAWIMGGAIIVGGAPEFATWLVDSNNG